MNYLPTWKLDDLPKPTKDLAHARADINLWGYCLLKDAVPTSLVERCRLRLREQAAAEKEQEWFPRMFTEDALHTQKTRARAPLHL